MKKYCFWRGLTALLCLGVMWLQPVLADVVFEEYWELAYQVDYDCYVASVDGVGLNMRWGAGTEYELALTSPIPDGTKIHIEYETVSAHGNKWGYTQYADTWGWVYLPETSKEEPEAPPASTVPTATPAVESATPAVESDVPAVESAAPIVESDVPAVESAAPPTTAPTPAGQEIVTPTTLLLIAIVALAVVVTALAILLIVQNNKKEP